MATADRPAWMCDCCGQPIMDGLGHALIDQAETLTGEAHWTVAHLDCLDAAEEPALEYGFELPLTLEGLLRRTLIVGERGLVASTDWSDVVFRALTPPPPEPPAPVRVRVRRAEPANVVRSVAVRRADEPAPNPRPNPTEEA